MQMILRSSTVSRECPTTWRQCADQFDPLSKITEWVENGIAPGTITAIVREDNQEAPEALRGFTENFVSGLQYPIYRTRSELCRLLACTTTLR